MEAEACYAHQGSSTETCLPATVTPSSVAQGVAVSKGPKLKTMARKQSQVVSPLWIKFKLPKMAQQKTVTMAANRSNHEYLLSTSQHHQLL